MKDETARELVRKIAEDEPPVPAWSKVTLRASFEDQFAVRRAPFARLSRVELAVYVGAGIAITALTLWAVMCILRLA